MTASDELQALYQDVILDHGRTPRNFRKPEAATRSANGRNPMCGDALTVFVTLNGGENLADVAFVGKGCAISMASASLMTEVLRGKSVAEAAEIFHCFHRLCTEDCEAEEALRGLSEDDAERLSVLAGVRNFPIRVKCATLPWHALCAALEGDEEATTE